jgi:ribose 5-phosphate isomerase A
MIGEEDPMSNAVDNLKKAAAVWAVSCLRDGMVVGLGSRSTATFAVAEIGRLVKDGLQVVGVSTSEKTSEQARSLGIPLATLAEYPEIDVTIDGADEVELQTLNLIKGGGGNQLREKMIAIVSKRLLIVVDESKLTERLGQHAKLPVEVVQFGWQSTATRLANLGLAPALRLDTEGAAFVTDGGNYILDCAFRTAKRAVDLQAQLDGTVGVVEHGLFIGMASEVVVGYSDGVKSMERHGREFLTRK